MLRRAALWILQSFFARQLDRALMREPDAFFAMLRRAGYPSTGETIFVHNRPRDRARFLAAVLWSLREVSK